jgi:HlyD family secretion protein
MRPSSIFRGVLAVVIVVGAAHLIGQIAFSGDFEAGVARAALPPPERIAASAPGRIEPVSEERDLAATAIGHLVYVADEGEKLVQGQIVAEIDNADLKAQLVAAEARIVMRQAELERLMNGARAETRHQAEAAVAEADANVRLAQAMLQRRRPLAASGAASLETLDRARADFDGAAARRTRLAEELALLNAPPRPEDVAIAKASLEMAKGDADALRAAIEKTRLRSPVDGVVLRRYRAMGETVSIQPATLIATVGDISRLRVRADVDEADVARVGVGQKVWVTADAYGERHFLGMVATVGKRLGRKSIRTDEPTEKLDTKVLQVVIDLEGSPEIPVGLRVDVFFRPLPENGTKVSQLR